MAYYCHWFKWMLLILLHAASSARGNSCRSKSGREVQVGIFWPISHVKVSYTCCSRADSWRFRYRILFAFIAWRGALVIKYHWFEALDLFAAAIKVIIVISLSLWGRGSLRKVNLGCLKIQSGILYGNLGVRGFNAFEQSEAPHHPWRCDYSNRRLRFTLIWILGIVQVSIFLLKGLAIEPL